MVCTNGKEIRRVQLELMKRGEPQGSPSAEAQLSKALPCDQICDLRLDEPPGELLRRSQRLIEETAYLTAKLRALEREIDGVLTKATPSAEAE